MTIRLGLMAVLLAFALAAQSPAPSGAFRVDLPEGAPVSLVSADWGQSQIAPRGGALQVDLRSTLLLKNISLRRIRGVSVLVLAQEVAAGGKASVTVPALDVAPGEAFPLRVDVRLMRPAAGAGALVEVKLDGVLFEDLTFYGPNRLNSRRTMTAWELEARRDRKSLLATLEHGGAPAVREEMVATLGRLASMPRLDIQVARAGRSTVQTGTAVRFAALSMPEAPVQLTGAEVVASGQELRFPRIEMANRSARAIRFVDVGWQARDRQGRQFVAGSLPATVQLAGKGRATLERDQAYRVTAATGPVEFAEVSGFVGLVEFDDGEIWVPSKPVSQVTGEQQRLAEMYRRKGIEAVLAELKKLR
ncbi:MAG TPA: hypothetical protein PKJ41_13250 [Bryobacteraceae bacterium]|nr:hypothetical protein [Bryobacteraceae bacterium]HPT28649.1 hypothetical protein [Bryobacteraceae bacterium]